MTPTHSLIPLKILVVEDSPDDTALLLAALESCGYAVEYRRVQDESEFLTSLREDLDVIFADYSLPSFSAARALELLRLSHIEIPFIVFSGTIREEQAVECVKAGATDYLLKDRLQRLWPAVERARREKRERQDRDKAEHQLRIQATALETAANAIMITDPQGIIAWVNPAFTKVSGYGRDEVLGKHSRMLKSGQHQAEFYADLWRTILAGRTWQGEFTNRRKDGRLFYGEQTISAVRAPHGAITHFVGIMNDVTARRETEAALRQSEERLRLITETIDEVFWMADVTISQMVFISPGYERVWGRSLASLHADPRSFIEAIHPEDRGRVVSALGAQRQGRPFEHEYRIVRPDGSVRWILDRGFPLPGQDGRITHYVGAAQDITDRKRLEEQFLQSQKMDAIGQLAGGVAHDFNNLLAVIRGYADLLLLEADPANTDATESLKQIIGASERAVNLTRQLLVFSRRQVLQPRVLNLNEVVTNLAKMLQRIIGEDIRLQLRLHPQPLMTYADPGMMDQILMNLSVNARDAMPDGGRLVIETADKTIDGDFARLNPDAAPGRYAWLSVSDTGTGISPQVLSRIFEPFFTTKAPGKGTGLGLATVFGIVKQHKGWLRVYSEPGHGANFQVYLPASEATPENLAQADKQIQPPGGSETILVVEDDARLRTLTITLLEGAGYRVLSAPDGVQARTVWEQQQGNIDLLLTDLVMPEGLSGRELASQLSALKPCLKVIFTSGYSAEIAGRELTLDEGRNFLQKPCAPRTLLQSIRRCLDA